jgi:hypothetical protein
MPPSTTFIQEPSTYSGSSFANNDDVAGAISDGFSTTAFPAAIAPITGSIDSTDEGETIILNIEQSSRMLTGEQCCSKHIDTEGGNIDLQYFIQFLFFCRRFFYSTSIVALANCEGIILNVSKGFV